MPEDSDYPVQVQALTNPVELGTSASFLLENGSAEVVAFNLCTDGVLERSTAAGWVVLARLPLPCPLSLEDLDPAQSRHVGYPVPEDAPRGVYRLRIRFIVMPSLESIIRRSASFLAE